MLVDHQTLRDLEVQGTPSGAPDLLDFLDRTRTRGGREALRRRLVEPLRTARAIEAVQRSLRFIADHRSAFIRLPDEAEVNALRRYLDSRFATLSSVKGPGLAMESLWVRRRYPDIFQEATRGVRLVGGFLTRIDELYAQLSAPPEPLSGLLAQIRALLDKPELQQVRSALPRFGRTPSILLRDHAARDSARTTLHRLIDVIAEIDALVSMSDATAEHDLVFPIVDDDHRGLEFRALRHPFLPEPAPNDLALPPGDRLLFLTGPNMAGKSTYLKAAGVAVLLAHAGMGVPARSARLGTVRRMITAIRTEDDLRSGISYFQAEARRVRDISRQLSEGDRCLVIADELFRGTNVKDACDASITVLATFAGFRQGHFLVASHLTELADELRNIPGVVFRRFEAAVTGQALNFDYRLKEGVSDQRLGMMVLETEGVLEMLARVRALGSAPAS